MGGWLDESDDEEYLPSTNKFTNFSVETKSTKSAKGGKTGGFKNLFQGFRSKDKKLGITKNNSATEPRPVFQISGPMLSVTDVSQQPQHILRSDGYRNTSNSNITRIPYQKQINYSLPEMRTAYMQPSPTFRDNADSITKENLLSSTPLSAPLRSPNPVVPPIETRTGTYNQSQPSIQKQSYYQTPSTASRDYNDSRGLMSSNLQQYSNVDYHQNDTLNMPSNSTPLHSAPYANGSRTYVDSQYLTYPTSPLSPHHANTYNPLMNGSNHSTPDFYKPTTSNFYTNSLQTRAVNKVPPSTQIPQLDFTNIRSFRQFPQSAHPAMQNKFHVQSYEHSMPEGLRSAPLNNPNLNRTPQQQLSPTTDRSIPDSGNLQFPFSAPVPNNDLEYVEEFPNVQIKPKTAQLKMKVFHNNQVYIIMFPVASLKINDIYAKVRRKIGDGPDFSLKYDPLSVDAPVMDEGELSMYERLKDLEVDEELEEVIGMLDYGGGRVNVWCFDINI